MAKNKQRVQKNQAKKKARASARKKQKKQQQGRGPGNRFAEMGCTRAELEQSPIHEAFVGNSIFTRGMGYVIIARELPDGRIAFGVFLIDAYCLGVKDAFLSLQTPREFEETKTTRFDGNDLQSVPPAQARKLVEDAIAYARDLGIEPHKDFREASLVLGDIDSAACQEVFTFGYEGKPLYISGPNDSEQKVRRIAAKLNEHQGS